MLDLKYKEIMDTRDILKNEALIDAGKAFFALHHAQIEAVKIASKRADKKAYRKKEYRTKALTESVLCGWSFVAGLLQTHPERLANHYEVPKTDKRKDVIDPLNADGMAKYKHDNDKATYRGLATRSSPLERQRVAQLFLAKSTKPKTVLTTDFMDKAVSQVYGISMLARGYV